MNYYIERKTEAKNINNNKGIFIVYEKFFLMNVNFTSLITIT